MVDLTMKHDKFARVNQCIREAAREAAEHGLSASVVEQFLRTGDRTWDGAGSGRFSPGQFKEDEAYSRAVSHPVSKENSEFVFVINIFVEISLL